MRYYLFAIINTIFGILLLSSVSTSDPGFLIVIIIGLILTIMGLIGCVLLLRKKNHPDILSSERLDSWFNLVRTFDIVLIIGLFFRVFIAQPFLVEGASMEKNFHNNEILLVDKISFRFAPIKRGDVLVFHSPKIKKDDYIKRVIGLPGEKITITNGKVYINDKLLSESYLSSDAKTIVSGVPNFEKNIGSDEYFMMGDNRQNSSDSREWGMLPRKNIIGKTWIVIYPFKYEGIIRNPNPTLN